MSNFSQFIASRLFWPLAAVTRPWGGLRPHRFMHWLGKQAAGPTAPAADQFRWCQDRYGIRMRLHPYFLIDRHILAFGEYESPLQRFIQSHLKPGAICLDVGANIGAVTLPLAQHCGPSGRVIAFEPNPPVAERLREHVQANGLQQVQVEACALSDTPGEMRLAIASQAHENQGMSSLVEFSHGDLTDSVTVPVQTLDTFAADHQLTRIDFIKVDIQGAEPLFLKGAAHTIERFQPTIAMELAASSLADTHTTAADLVRLLERLGLQGFELGQDGQLGNRIVADELPVDYGQDNAIFLAR